MIHLTATFDLRRDVISDIVKKEETAKATAEVLDPRILNVERDGGVLYCWRGATGTTRIGKYNPHTKHNKLLYTFDKQVCVSSCSLNKEETLLAVSLTQNQRQERLRPVSKCLTLLIEIHPINNTKVLKAVDCRVRVQFLHPDSLQTCVLESHLLLITEDGYVDLYHIMLARHEGYRVVVLNPDSLAKERLVEELSWVQWDSHNQRLYTITSKESPVLRCVQFYSERNCETVFELHLELPANSFSSVSFVHLGFDHYQDEKEGISLVIFTDKTGIMCVCYSHPACGRKEVRYTVAFVHKGCSKTFNVALNQESLSSSSSSTNLQPQFLRTGHYVLVFLAGHFLHLLNTRQQDLLCYSFFLSGSEACLGLVGGAKVIGGQGGASLLDEQSGCIYTPTISPSHLLTLLQDGTPEAQRLATLQCMLGLTGVEPDMERQVIDCISGSMLSFEAFDQIQEFILASLYRITHQQSLSLDMVLPYSSVFEKKELPVALTRIPGVKCTPDLLPQPLIRGKGRNTHSYWAELQCVCEQVKHLETMQSPRFRTSNIQEELGRLQTGLSSEKRRVSHQRHLEENTKKVLSMVDTWRLDRRVVPLFQEEDPQQKAHIGLLVDKLREHLNRHLPHLGKKRTDALVVNYVAKLLELVHHMLETLWHKYKLGPQVLNLTQQGSPEEWSVFHVMLRILEATKSLCLPLPPGYNSLLSVLGVRCVSRHSFLQFVDHRILQLTEPLVTRIMKDLDNSDVNEALKFSILKRLPEAMLERVYHLLDHPVSSACISREYVRNRLRNQDKNTGFALDDQEHSSLWPDFLPLSYLTKVLSDLEEKALNPFEEQENIDARFVEETALKQTLIQLGLDNK